VNLGRTLDFTQLSKPSQSRDRFVAPRKIFLRHTFDNNVPVSRYPLNLRTRQLHEVDVVDDEEYRGIWNVLWVPRCWEMVPGPAIDVVTLDEVLHVPED
jgi:hypothetical protein